MIFILGVLLSFIILVISIKDGSKGLLCLVFLTLCLPTYYTSWDYFNIGFRVYLIDITIVSLFAKVILGKIKILIPEELKYLLNAWFLLGVFSFGYSIYLGKDLSDIIGFFRRIIFYPITIILLFNTFIKYPNAFIKKVKQFLPYVMGIVILLVLVRYGTGTSYSGQLIEGSYEFGEDFRALSHMESLGIIFIVLYYLGLILDKGNKINKLSYVYLSLGLIVLMLSGFRIVVISLVIGIILTVIFYQRSKLKSIIQLMVLGLFLFFTVFAYTNYFSTASELQINRYLSIFSANSVDSIAGFGWRFTLWESIIKDIIEKPIFGNGIGHSIIWYDASSSTYVDNDPHNILLNLLVKFGLLGTVVFILFQYQVLKIFMTTVKNEFIFYKAVFISYILLLFIGMLQPSIFSMDGVILYSIFISLGLIKNKNKFSLNKNFYNNR